MSTQALAAALQRVQKVLQRRPDMAVHDDSPAIARWQAGTRVVSRNPNGTEVATDMPTEVGGSGDQVTPGWLLRAGLAACAATRIAMAAAAEGVELSSLQVEATSRSDTRGLLGMPDAQGKPVDAGPLDVELSVRISAPSIPAGRLRAMVEEACRCSPVPAALRSGVPLALHIDVETP
ncbi:MAG TPA: OsmC family protein [Steroidobacteraceae bacterium]|nr:OsmC family protein [Steroidobacteraceae bacterium]